jgi:hypothetical protein
MKLGGQSIREPVEHERGLMREDAHPLGPKPCANELLVLARREVHQAVDASTDANGAPTRNVVHQKLGRVAGLGSLPRREESLLRSCDFVQTIPNGVPG